MLSFKEWLAEQDLNENVKIKKTTKIIDALKSRYPEDAVNGTFDKVHTSLTIEGVFSSIWVLGDSRIVLERCGNNKDTVNKLLELVAEAYDEDPTFFVDYYNGKYPKRSKHIKKTTKVVSALKRYFDWDGGIKRISQDIDPKLTLKDVWIMHLQHDSINDLNIGDSEVENYVCWLTSIAMGVELYRSDF